MQRSFTMALVLAMATVSARAHAKTPTQFSIQGVLRDSAGKLQVNPVNVTVKLYAAQTGGDALATPVTSVSVKPVNGLFTVAIPVDAALAEVLANPPVWTELSVGNATYPRQLVTAAKGE